MEKQYDDVRFETIHELWKIKITDDVRQSLEQMYFTNSQYSEMKLKYFNTFSEEHKLVMRKEFARIFTQVVSSPFIVVTTWGGIL